MELRSLPTSKRRDGVSLCVVPLFPSLPSRRGSILVTLILILVVKETMILLMCVRLVAVLLLEVK